MNACKINNNNYKKISCELVDSHMQGFNWLLCNDKSVHVLGRVLNSTVCQLSISVLICHKHLGCINRQCIYIILYIYIGICTNYGE